jgi:hypothetical protein
MTGTGRLVNGDSPLLAHRVANTVTTEACHLDESIEKLVRPNLPEPGSAC